MGRRIVVSLLTLLVFSLVGLTGVNLAQANMIDLHNFDFGSDNSPVQDGWLQVTDTTLYSSQLGYGWDDKVSATNPNANPPEYPNMLADFNHSSKDQTFRIDLAAGTYSIELYFFDNNNHDNNWTVYLGDSSTVLATVTALRQDTEVIKQFDITMASAGQLDLRFQTDTGTWQINGIKVAQEVPVTSTILLFSAGLLGLAGLRRFGKG